MKPFEGNHKADVAPGENEFDTPGFGCVACSILPLEFKIY